MGHRVRNPETTGPIMKKKCEDALGRLKELKRQVRTPEGKRRPDSSPAKAVLQCEKYTSDMLEMFDAVESVVENAKVTCSNEFIKSFEFANQESKLATASRLEKDILLHEERVKQLLLEG